jgi:hypothetical protein
MSKSNRIVAARKHRDPKRESCWRGWLNRQSRSGLGVRAFCDREELKETAFYFWRREIQRRDSQADAKRPAAATFIELVPTPVPVTESRSAIELLLPLDRRVLIRGGFDAALLRQVLAVLEGRPC